MITKRILSALFIGGLLAVAAPSASAEPTTFVTTGPVFNDPKDPEGIKQKAILGHVGRLIGGATSGSTIRISLYAFGSDWIANLLADAHRRNVNVQVLVDHTSIETDSWMGKSGESVKNKLDAAFAEVPPAGTTYGTSWFRVCAENQPCLAKSTVGVNHNKFFLFSRTTGSGSPENGVPVDNVVVQSSGNLTLSDLTVLWNDAMTVAGNEALHTGYTGYFDTMAASQARTDGSLRTTNLSIDAVAGPAKAYFFPRASTDVIFNILSTVDNPVNGTEAVCHGNTPGHGTSDGRTVIRIANGHISRPAVAKKLWELADAGCYIDIVYGKLSDYEALGEHRETAYWLTRSTKLGKISLHRLNNGKLKDPATGQVSGTTSHTKYMLVEGSYKGLKDQKIVFTGSHTFTGLALTDNDEALLKYESKEVHDAYLKNFRAQRAASVAEAQYGGVE
ncbi:phospholipase D-like domain-containing protein [Streptomyces sp. TRM49041]|uniref:phospholipase D-like domain-containing protein n=1 Tax=Streptomyces sp. TRM49041 TaxID=2603216 RepID=UPI0011ED204C|nr:phospholipase D-like domain-containing protein [Streptomyces sp. TRM49041]